MSCYELSGSIVKALVDQARENGRLRAKLEALEHLELNVLVDDVAKAVATLPEDES